MTERDVSYRAADGQRIAGALLIPPADRCGAALLVHGSRHERDAYGPTLPRLLAERGIAALRIDVRGRGRSSDPIPYRAMAPLQRRAVRLDVAAGVAYLARLRQVGARRIAIVAEQDGADAALPVCARDARVAACVLISGRLGAEARAAAARSRAPALCLVSKEDRRGLADMVDAYLASRHRRSRLLVYDGIGFGTTMFSAWQFEHPGEPPIEETIAEWLAGVVGYAAKGRPRRAREGSR